MTRSDQVKHKPGCTATEEFRNNDVGDCSIYVTKTKALISCKRVYRAADLRVCFSHMKKEYFRMTRVKIQYASELNIFLFKPDIRSVRETLRLFYQFDLNSMSLVVRKPVFEFLTWPDTNRAVQSQKMASS